MATNKKVIFEIGIDGKQAESQIDNIKNGAFDLQTQLDAVKKLGFGKAVAQGFIQGREQIEKVSAALEEQKKATDVGTAAYEKNAKAALDAQKEVEKFVKADVKAANDAAKEKINAEKEVEKARLDSLKKTLSEQGGFAKAIADGSIKTVADIRTAYEFLKKNSPFGSDDLKQAEQYSKTFDKVYRDIGQDTQDFFETFRSGMVVVNKSTGEAVLNTEALEKAYEALPEAIKETTDAVKELDLQFDNLSVNELEQSIADVSVTQLEKEIDGLRKKLSTLDEIADFQAFDEITEKIKIAENELQERLLPAFADLSLQEVVVEINQSSRKRLEAQVEDLQNEFNKLKPSDKGYTELQEKLKLVKNRLIDIDEVSAGIKSIDLTQAYVDIGTKGVEGLANASRAVGALSGNLAEAEELAAQFDKALQLISVAQSAVDSVKAYGEAMKGTNGSLLSAANGAKVFKLALAATGIGAVVLAVTLLISQFGGLKKVLGVITDALSSVGDALGVIPKFVKENGDEIINTFLAIAKSVGSILFTIPRLALAAFQAIKDVFSGKSIGDALKDAGQSIIQPFRDAFNGVKDLGSKLGSDLSDAFNKGFDARQGLRENERKKKLLESLNAERAARQSALEAQLSDETLNFEQQKKLALEIIGLRKAQVADELALNKERIGLLKQLGANASEEQKEELKELTATVADQQAQIIQINRDAQQQIRDLLVASQEQKLLVLQRESDKTVEILERRLADERALANMSAKQEIDLINQVQDARLKVIEAEIEAIKGRGKLTLDETNRLKELEKSKSDLAIETNDRIKASATRRIENEIELSELLAEVKQKQFERETAANEKAQLLEGQRAEQAQRDLDKQAAAVNTITDATKLQAATVAEIAASSAFQTQQLETQANIEKQTIELERERLQLQIESIKLRAQGKDLTEAEKLQIESLNEDLKKLTDQTQAIDVKLGIDKKNIENEATDAVKAAGEATTQAAIQYFADPITAELKNGLMKGLKLDGAQADAVIGSFNSIKDSALEIFAQINAAQQESIQNQIDALDKQIETADEVLEKTKTDYEDALQEFADLQSQLADQQGSEREALIAQIDAQAGAIKKAAAAEKKAAADKIALEDAKAAKEAELAEKQKEMAKLDIVIKTAQTYAALALAIAQAFNLPPPAGIVSGLAVAAAAGSAVAATLAAVNTFEDGGVLPSYADGGVVKGARHSAGGVQVVNKSGVHIAEVEGGEGIVNRRAMQIPHLRNIVSSVNASTGGKRFEDGGVLPSTMPAFDSLSTANTDIDKQLALLQKIADKENYLALTDLNRAQKGAKVIESASRL